MSESNIKSKIPEDLVTYEAMVIQLRKKILRLIDDIDNGFKRVMLMYTIAFLAGIAIILFSVVSTVLYGTNMFTLIFGAVGVLDVIAFFVFKPTEDLQKSRANMAQLVSAVMAWNNDMKTWADLKSAKLGNPTDNLLSEMDMISKRMMINTIAVMMAVDIFVEGRHTDIEIKRLQEILKMFQDGVVIR